jgi:hypothetical protein
MNAIDPSNNYGGGKVKFFAGGSGGGGQTIRLLPIMIGSNNATTTIEGVGMIPLNATQWLNDGGDNANDYDDSFYALSYLPRIDNPYYYYLTTGSIQAVSLSNADVDLDLIIDGVIIETISITLNAGNSYTSLFGFTQTPQLNEYAVERYGIRLNQRFGTATKFLLSTTNVFLSVYNENELKSEFFTSSNLNGLEMLGNDKKYFGFGGQTNTNSAGGIPFVRCIVGNTAITQVWKVYFMLSQNAGLGDNFIRIGLFVDDNLVEEFEVLGDITAYTPQEFTLATPTQISLSGNTYISVFNSSDTSIYLFEVGICGYEILD